MVAPCCASIHAQSFSSLDSSVWQSNDEKDWAWMEAQQGATTSNSASSKWYGHTVWYDAGGGDLPFFPEVQITGTKSSSIVEYLTSRLRTGKPERAGYTFTGWEFSTQTCLGGDNITLYSAEAYYAQHTLTAIWEPISGEDDGEYTCGYVIIYNTNGGTVPFESVYQVISESCSSKTAYIATNFYDDVPTKSDYVFAGWTLRDTDGSTIGLYQPGEGVTLWATDEDYYEWPIYTAIATWSAASATSGYVRIYTPSGWKKAIPHVYYSGAWHTAIPYVYKSNDDQWHPTG